MTQFFSKLTAAVVALYITFHAMPALASKEMAEQFIRQVSGEVLASIRNKSVSDSQKEKKLISIFKDSVDSAWMGRFSLGRYYRQASTAQKKQYLGLYQEFLIQSYVPRFREYAGEEFKVVSVRGDDNGQYVVQTEIIPPDDTKPKVRVDYKLHKNKQGKMKVIDIVGEGISLITTQRSDFSSLISRKGLDSFLERLTAKVQSFK